MRKTILAAVVTGGLATGGLAPAAILLYPLQLIAQAELVLFGRSAR